MPGTPNYLDLSGCLREMCDDGNILSEDGCHSDCQVERCGDRWVDLNGLDNIPGNADDEGCDDGNLNNFDTCPNDCSSLCGDGVKEALEECDDGNLINGDGCSPIAVRIVEMAQWKLPMVVRRNATMGIALMEMDAVHGVRWSFAGMAR